MPEFNEVKIGRILNPTSIDLGEYVVNPFMGCEFSCLYCYVRSNRVVSRKRKPWGTYVDIRINAGERLEKEILVKKPKTVLLGSTTECFQPIEKKYQITRKILEILNAHKIFYVILTRSPYILEYLPLLKEGFCKNIYFTVNKLNQEFKSRLEPKSPAFEIRDDAVRSLLKEGLPVVPYFSPVIPWVSDIQGIFARFTQTPILEFESLNFRLQNIQEIMSAIVETEPSLREKYDAMLTDRQFYVKTWHAIKQDIEKQAGQLKKRYNMHIHQFGDYFKNRYRCTREQL